MTTKVVSVWLGFIVSAFFTTSWGLLLNSDEGFEKACKQSGGDYTQRAGNDSNTGDICLMKFSVVTSDEQDARDFCELNAPWRLREARRETQDSIPVVICDVEATYTCNAGWIQMYGYCFKMSEMHDVYTHEEAEKYCKEQAGPSFHGEIASIHQRYILTPWKNYFRTIKQFWVQAPETWNEYVVKTNKVDGDYLALAFFGDHFEFSVPVNSLIKINGNVKLQALCQYKPAITPAEINYMGRRYSEIYYPTVPVKDGIIVRSASSYTRSSNQLDVCKKVLKPYMYTKESHFFPDPDSMEQLAKLEPETYSLMRSPLVSEIDQSYRNRHNCQTPGAHYEVVLGGKKTANFVVEHDKIKGKPTCDNMMSASISHFKGQAPEFHPMVDSQSLPIWCKLGKVVKYKFDVPPGWLDFRRLNGQVVLHWLSEEKLKFTDAAKACEAKGAHLAGINSLKEAEQLGNHVVGAKLNNEQFWLGAQRKTECLENNDWKAPCTRGKIFEWNNNVATDFREEWWKKNNNNHSPNPSGTGQRCLSFAFGDLYWSEKGDKGFLDDIECHNELRYFCSKMATFTECEENCD
ncbi:C-type lectin domain-containing protein [Caenorhabditis elegans]|uniref:C-type lectin domain-containing protein n=1 Tax=Caenorhabditis elegans TaxID=6239 RepID=Q20528_CAEEL|nr:C-type lectin domain-containing protein [Caenorhabditis elegans]CCD71379.1 C-type lectin domain-containing protein [Caenorhabditis elegans]|eukprot:NP_500450.1 C-type LECtin [Caenorhabditis elegans]